MDSKSIFNVDSNIVRKMSSTVTPKFFFQIFAFGHPGFEKKKTIFLEGALEDVFAYIFGIYIKVGYRNHQS